MLTARISLVLVAAALLGVSCSRSQKADDLADTVTGAVASSATSSSSPTQATVKTGADVLFAQGFSSFTGRRVGAIVNQASVIDTTHVVDAMLAAGVNVAALFGPEHGVRGNEGAGVAIEDGIDARTGIQVFSLYGSARKPDPAVLADLDVLLFDIQDVGARFYTYISTMGLAMQAAADAGIEFVVLDRPNPLGGTYVAGFVLEPGFESFVGQYPIPVAHGMTVGELARAIVGERWLDGLDSLRLTVVPMENWRRSMQWPATGKTWIPTSPNIPDYATASVYPGMCFVEALNIAEGRGTPHPFLQFGAPWINAESIATGLNASATSGYLFSPVTFTPRANPVAAPNPRLRDTQVHGARIRIASAVSQDPLRLGMEVLVALRDFAAAGGVNEFGTERSLFREASMRRLAGTNRLYQALESGKSADEIVALWNDEVASFREVRNAYLMYDE